MKWHLFVFILTIWALTDRSHAAVPTPVPSQGFAQALGPTPVFSAPTFPGAMGDAGALNRRVKLFHGLLFTAWPGTAFTVLERRNAGKVAIARVTTSEYPCLSCWIDARHVRFSARPFPERAVKMPSRRDILRFLEGAAARGVPYCWGCNFSAGVPSLRRDYGLTARQLARYPWDFAGLDCSGILFEATGGATPRDTNRLLVYGDPVRIQGKTMAQIQAMLQPLDLIIWQGHMLIVIENGFVVESANRYRRHFVRKAMKSPLAQRLGEVVWQRKPVNNYFDQRLSGRRRFVVRRWHPSASAGVRP